MLEFRNLPALPTDDEVAAAIHSVPPHFGFEAGYDKYTTFKASGLGAFTRIDVVDHSWKEMVDAIDVTDTSAAGIQALLAGILRGDGKIKAVWKSSLNPHANAAPKFYSGINGLMRFYYSNTFGPYEVPCLVVSIASTSSVPGRSEWDGEVRLNSIAGAYLQPT